MAFVPGATRVAPFTSSFTPRLCTRSSADVPATPARAAPSRHARVKCTLGEEVKPEVLSSSSTSAETMQEVEGIVALVKEHGLTDFRYSQDDLTVEITMPGGRGFEDGKLKDLPPVQAAGAVGPASAAPASLEAGEMMAADVDGTVIDEQEVYETEEVEQAEAIVQEEPDEDGVFPSDFVVTSNRVGFFFSGAKSKPPLVNVDDHVDFNQPVCIIEQLGQQYVYLSEVSGTVVKVFVEDGDAVEFGTRVMVIRPD